MQYVTNIHNHAYIKTNSATLAKTQLQQLLLPAQNQIVSAGLARMKSLIVAVMVVTMMANLVVEAQDLPACVMNLVGCADYLNTTTTPPASCCIPLKEAVTDQLPCLCNLYNDPSLLKSFGINVTQVIELPARCGITFSIYECTGSQAPTSPIPEPQPGSTTPNSPAEVDPSAAPPPSSNTDRSATATYSGLFILAAAMLYWA